MFKIGDRIKLKDYSDYGDYRSHEGESAIINADNDGGDFDFTICWDDHEVSYARTNNMFRPSQEWDSQENVMEKKNG